MDQHLGPHERYLVVRSKEGWSVNLGADTLIVHSNREDARQAAAVFVRNALEAGRSADWLDVDQGPEMVV